MPTIKSRWRRLLLATAAAVLLLFGVYLLVRAGRLMLPCLFNTLTHLRCPGCGNTRAVLSYLQLDFATALRQNYLFPLEAAYLVWVYFFSARTYLKTGKLRYGGSPLWVDLSVCALILIWFVLRNLLHI